MTGSIARIRGITLELLQGRHVAMGRYAFEVPLIAHVNCRKIDLHIVQPSLAPAAGES